MLTKSTAVRHTVLFNRPWVRSVQKGEPLGSLQSRFSADRMPSPSPIQQYQNTERKINVHHKKATATRADIIFIVHCTIMSVISIYKSLVTSLICCEFETHSVLLFIQKRREINCRRVNVYKLTLCNIINTRDGHIYMLRNIYILVKCVFSLLIF